MSKILRKVQKIFGSSAAPNQIARFGSLAAGSPTFTTDPAVIQSLGNYLSGWFGAVIGANSPAIEDMNALCYLFAYQLSYVMQTGVPEWDATTIYFKGSLVNDGNGVLYVSLTDNNTGNALSSLANWTVQQTSSYNKIIGGPGFPNFSATTINDGDSILVVSDVSESVRVLVNVDNVRVDFLPGKKLLSTETVQSPFRVTGSNFRSNALQIRANAALGAAFPLLQVLGNDCSVLSAILETNHASIALTNCVGLGGTRNEVSASVKHTLGTSGAYVDAGTLNDSRIRQG